MEVTNRFVVIKNHIEGAPQDSDFELRSATISLNVELGSDDVIVKNLYLSIDPYQINRTKHKSSWQSTNKLTKGIAPREAISAYGVAKVVVSANPEFEKDDLVVGYVGWGENSVIGGDSMLKKLDFMGFPLSYHVGVFSKLSWEVLEIH